MSLLQTKAQLSAIGLDVDHNEYRAVQLVRSGEDVRTHAWAIFPRQDGPEGGARFPDDQELSWAHEIMSRRGFVGDLISLAGSTELCTSHHIELPPAQSGAPIEQIARMEIARERRCGPEDFELGHWELPAKGRVHESLAVAYPRSEVDSTVEIFEQAGFVPAGMDLMELALCRAILGRNGMPVKENEINAILHVGWESSLAVLTIGGVVSYVRRIESGASQVWEMVNKRFQLLGQAGDDILNGDHADDHSEAWYKVQRAVWSGLAGELAQELDVAVAYVSHSYRMAPLGTIRLSGYGASNSMIKDHLDEVIGIPIVIGAPPELLDGIVPQRFKQSIACRLVPAFGLAARFDT